MAHAEYKHSLGEDTYDYEENATDHERVDMFKCRNKFIATELELRSKGFRFCQSTWDSASCWPPTLLGNEARVACPIEFHDVHYDTKYNATRPCFANGTWALLSDYEACTNNTINSFPETHDGLFHMGVIGTYYIGYSISFISSCVALWLFIYFRTLHCLRNTLHCNLIITYILVDLTWIIMTSIITQDSTAHASSKSGPDDTYRIDCRLIVALFTYFQVTNFFWMLVEGLYIILIIYRTHKLELLCYWPFALVGWGLPVCVITTWVTVKITMDDKECWINTSSPYDFIYIGPILFVLSVNVMFLCTIMHLLLRKYRGTTTTVISTRRTAKSFLILLPLLGITYVMVLVIPKETGALRTTLDYVNAVATSLQGFFVSLLYCFLNNEGQGFSNSKLTMPFQNRFLGVFHNDVVNLGSAARPVKLFQQNDQEAIFVSGCSTGRFIQNKHNKVRAIIRLRGNSFFPYRTWLKLDTSATRRSPRSITTSVDPATGNHSGDPIVQQPPALSRYRQNENLRRLQINTVTANKNELAYLLKEKEYHNRIQKQMRHQAMGYRSTVF